MRTHGQPSKQLFLKRWTLGHNMSRVMRKQAFCICENKDADQLHGNREADQRLCFRYVDSTIPLLPKCEIWKPLVFLYNLVCVGPGRKPQRPVFSQRGSYNLHKHKVKTSPKLTSKTNNRESQQNYHLGPIISPL